MPNPLMGILILYATKVMWENHFAVNGLCQLIYKNQIKMKLWYVQDIMKMQISAKLSSS